MGLIEGRSDDITGKLEKLGEKYSESKDPNVREAAAELGSLVKSEIQNVVVEESGQTETKVEDFNAIMSRVAAGEATEDDASNVASDITKILASAYTSMPPQSLSSGSDAVGPHTKATADKFNQLTSFIQSSVLQAGQSKQLAGVAKAEEFWIDVAVECYTSGDLCSAVAITTGLSQAAILRLGKSEKVKLSADHKAKLADLERISSPAGNWKGVREGCRAARAEGKNTYLPLFIVGGDITFTHDGNPRTVKNDAENAVKINNDQPANIPNFERLLLLSNQVQSMSDSFELVEKQASKSTYTTIDDVLADTDSILSEKAAYELSLSLLPR